MRARLVAIAYTAGWGLLRWLPEPVARRLFQLIADVVTRRNRRGVARLRDNLSRVTQQPDVDPLVRAGMRSYLRYWCEVFRLPVLSAEDVVRRTRTIDEHHFREALTAGAGTVVALPHMGNWDLAGAWAVATGAPFTTVAERLQPAALFDRFVSFRQSIGMEVVPLTGGERAPVQLLRERLLAGGLVCLLGDRDLTASGVEVTFFGARTKVPAGPAALALDTGAALVPATLWFEGEQHVIRFHPPVRDPGEGTRAERVAAMSQRVMDAFAEGIAAHPQDWHMLQRVWL